MKRLSFLRSITFNMPAYVILFCALVAFAICYIGYTEFENLSDTEYTKFSNQFAYTALSYIDADKLVDYARTRQADEEWKAVNERLRYLTDIGYLAEIAVVIPDPDNYNSYTYVFDTINTTISTMASPHPLGATNTESNSGDNTIHDKLMLVIGLGINHSEFIEDEYFGAYIMSGIPITNSQGENVAAVLVKKPMNEQMFLRQRYLRSTIIASIVITLFIVVLYIFMVIFKILRPLRFITFETSHFAEHGGTLSGVLKKVHNKDEFGILAHSIEKMSEDMTKYISAITSMAAEKERISTELNVATEIQANMLPTDYPAFPDRNDFDLFASMTPAKEVGGDLYNYLLLDDDHLLLTVGDVSGKGVPAALFMVITKTLLTSHAVQHLSPSEILETTNNQLCENNTSSMFVTCWLGILTLSTGELRFVNAAHPHAIIYSDGEFKYLETKANLMLGGMEGTVYDEHIVTLKHGDRLLIYTDGVTEATDENNVLFAEERLLESAKKTLALNAKDTVKSITEDINEFIGKADQFDDLTMLDFIYN
ncbi:MAG: serine/threonine-protein phosphatase [Treponema sp.]|nr:serine/threonine-protein phosphatase [Treponema sp.]